MSQNDFRFKQFVVRQDRCAMKVGTDGVLLGSWVQPGNAQRILDIGTGTGLIALMMAQRSTAIIDAIDIDSDTTNQAEENFKSSAWSDRLRAIPQSLQEFASHRPERYDLIVSNPPYFMGAHPAPSEARNIARHMDESLSIEELASCVKALLSPQGRFCVILPFMEGMKFREYAELNGLFATHLTKVKTKIEKQEKRLMMEFKLHRENQVEDELVIQEEDMSYTLQYIELTNDFYMGLPKSRN
ncbi:MAG: methyltransferase [Bacteroidota bacterium]|nr:methyltransferase [Bacteroidota bacterium]